MPYVVTENCILCGACISGCESNAIEEGDTQAHIDVSICVECGTCERNCPSDAIIWVDETDEAAQRYADQSASLKGGARSEITSPAMLPGEMREHPSRDCINSDTTTQDKGARL